MRQHLLAIVAERENFTTGAGIHRSRHRTRGELSYRWREDHTVMTAQVHEGEESQQSVVIGIEVSVLERLVLRLPECLDEFAALVVAAHHGSSSRRGHQSDAMAQFTETASLQNLVFLRQGTVHTVLVNKSIDTLGVKEVLDGLSILALPLFISTAPLIVERNVHGYAP